MWSLNLWGFTFYYNTEMQKIKTQSSEKLKYSDNGGKELNQNDGVAVVGCAGRKSLL